jgi:hypothetical protein
MWMTFTYICPKSQRKMRMLEGAHAPRDARELQREQQAAEKADWAWLDELVKAAAPPNEDSHMDGTSDFSKHVKEDRRVRVPADRTAAELQRAATQRPVGRRRKPLPLLTSSGLPKFYHSRSCVAMTAAELEHGGDSDDGELDLDEWKVRISVHASLNLLLFCICRLP